MKINQAYEIVKTAYAAGKVNEKDFIGAAEKVRNFLFVGELSPGKKHLQL